MLYIMRLFSNAAAKASVSQKHVNRSRFASRIVAPGFIFLPASDIMVSYDSVQRGKEMNVFYRGGG